MGGGSVGLRPLVPNTVNMGDHYFDGDPALDSKRRHMERVLKGEGSRKKWPLVLMALGGGGLWAIWKTAAEGRSREAAGTTGTPSSGPGLKTRHP